MKNKDKIIKFFVENVNSVSFLEDVTEVISIENFAKRIVKNIVALQLTFKQDPENYKAAIEYYLRLVEFNAKNKVDLKAFDKEAANYNQFCYIDFVAVYSEFIDIKDVYKFILAHLCY
jgi:hypothetical protein